MNTLIERKIAILVDGDNAQPKLLKDILTEVSKYGQVTIRKVYGDWMSELMKGWKPLLNETSFDAVQNFAYTKGKNATDSALIIDAMDILYSKNVDGFCIVSSDSDFTGLAKRLRQDGIFVMGVGEKQTPSAFVNACAVFTYCETLQPESKSPKAKSSVPEALLILLNKAYDTVIGDDSQVALASLGIALRKIDPAFDHRTYGYGSLMKLLQNTKTYELIDNKVGDLNHYLVRKK